MKAQDIMTRDVVAAGAATPIKEIADLLTRKRISGVPVLADGKLIGIVSQSDLIHRAELGTERRRKWWLEIFADPDGLAREYSKAHGLKAADVMSRPVVSVREDADLREVAETLEKQHLKRVPVVSDGDLVGIITRSDLVRALSQVEVARPSGTISNGELQKAVLEKIRSQPWLGASYISVTVSDGIVELGGFVSSADQRRALRILIEEVNGVKRVDDRLTLGFPSFGAV